MYESHLDFARERVMIISAPNGARRTQVDHPALPMTASELAAEAMALVEQQVSVLHLHVRERNGAHSLDPEVYREALSAIDDAVGSQLIVQVTSEAVGRYRQEEQMEMVRSLRPEAVSLALRELCPPDTSELKAARFYGFLDRENIWPQHILYSAQDITRFDDMRKRGVFADEHPMCLLVLGNYADGIEGSPAELEEKLEYADFSEFPWSVCCFGAAEHKSVIASTEYGGHVRLGFENNMLLENGSLAANNSALIEQYRQQIQGQQRVPAHVDEVRACFLTKN